jgi:hypothetical protein
VDVACVRALWLFAPLHTLRLSLRRMDMIVGDLPLLYISYCTIGHNASSMDHQSFLQYEIYDDSFL